MPFNGPGKETNVDLPDELVYCVQCGNVFVFHPKRDCPTCTLNERLDDLSDRMDRAERDIDIIDS